MHPQRFTNYDQLSQKLGEDMKDYISNYEEVADDYELLLNQKYKYAFLKNY